MPGPSSRPGGRSWSPQQVQRLVQVAVRRQDVLRGGDPIRLMLILDESVLLRAVAPPPVMRAQLEYLIDVGSQPHVTIQVLRLGCEHRQLPASSFGILSFAEPDDADVVCATGIRGQVLLEQRAREVAGGGGDVRSPAAMWRCRLRNRPS